MVRRRFKDDREMDKEEICLIGAIKPLGKDGRVVKVDMIYLAPLGLREVWGFIHRALPCAVYYAPLGLEEFGG